MISTHAPLAGRDPFQNSLAGAADIFQPTRPLRGATMDAKAAADSSLISTHAPLAGRDTNEFGVDSDTIISTHAPLAGRDAAAGLAIIKKGVISTHAPLAGRDPRSASS